MIRPSRPLRRARPSPQLAQALLEQEQRRPLTIQQRIQDIHARVYALRCATYILVNRYR